MALIICGVPRSGTTMLQRVCNGHPELSVTRETRLFAFPTAPFWLHARNVSGNTWRRAWSEWCSGYRRDLGARLWFTGRYLTALVPSRLSKIDTEAREHALQKLFPGARIVGDKYPGYVFELDQYARDDRLSCLVIYRDARDVTSSTRHAVQTAWKGRPFTVNVDTVKKIARRWVFGIEQMQRHHHEIHVVRYEDLVDDPKSVMAGVGEWLGVNPGAFPLEDVHGASVGKYRSSLSTEELKVVLDIAGVKLAELGYRLP